MPTLAQLQQQLDQFREISKNFLLEPLLTHKELARLGVAYQIELLDRIEQAILYPSGQENKLIFTGHRGCGKSTLLAELGFRLIESNKYFVVNFSIEDVVERSAVDHVNILFSMAIELLYTSERQSVKLKPGIKKELFRWLGKYTEVESKAVETAIETKGETTLKGEIPLLLEFLAKIRSTLKVNSVKREELTTEFARKISDLIAKINEIQTYIANDTGKQVLVIIDNLDKLDLSVAETIFAKNIGSLLGPSFAIIYTLPVAALRELSVRRSIEGSINQIHTMPVMKFFSKQTVRDPDRVPNSNYMALFTEILDKRLMPQLIDPDVKSALILASGGVLRELIRIVDRCFQQCKLELNRRIRQSQLDEPMTKIDQHILDQVLIDFQIEYSEPLGADDYELLKYTYDHFKAKSTQDQRFLDLLHGLYILEYRNASHWYDLSPMVIDLMREQGEL